MIQSQSHEQTRDYKQYDKSRQKMKKKKTENNFSPIFSGYTNGEQANVSSVTPALNFCEHAART